jgi:hypothetical protein
LNDEETDPDILQLFDELNEEWVERWRNGIKETKKQSSDLTLIVFPQEKPMQN